MTLRQKQMTDGLQEGLARVLRDADKQELLEKAANQPGSPEESGLRGLGKSICNLLLDYCSFKLDPVKDVDPFDDPFVGAALFTDRGELIAAHRKTGPNEPHAEAAVLMSALERVDTQEARDLLKRIRCDYKDKVWQQGPGKQTQFAGLFEEAGNRIRAGASTPEHRPRLVLAVTLEPCRDYESQPSCADLLAKFKPDLVLYAGDDTNPRGQGRDRLSQAGIPVVPNLAVSENVEVNKLFFASVFYLQELHRVAEEHPESPLALRYTVVRLSRLHPELRTDCAGSTFRANVVLEERPVYSAYAQHGRKADPLQAGAAADGAIGTADADLVMFTTDLEPGFLNRFMTQYSKVMGSIPGRLICPRSAGADAEHFLSKLKEKGVKIHKNVFRKTDDRFLALLHIRDWQSTFRSATFCVAKTKTDYRTFRVADLNGQTANDRQPTYADVTRVSMFVHANAANTCLQYAQRLVDSKEHAEAGLSITVVAENLELAETSAQNIRDQCSKFTEGSRFLVTSEVLMQAPEPRARRLHNRVVMGELDPVMLTKEHLDRMVEAPSWEERRDAGLFLTEAIIREPDLLKIAVDLPKTPSREDWARVCTLLMVLAKLDWATRPVERSKAIVKVQALAAGLNAQPQSSLPLWASDILLRLIRAAFALATQSMQIDSILGKGMLGKPLLAGDTFLLRELLLTGIRSTHLQGACEWVDGIVQTAIREELLDEAQLIPLVTRTARLSALWPEASSQGLGLALGPTLEHSPRLMTEYRTEIQCCRHVLEEGLSGVFRCLDEDRYRRMGSYLFLRTARVPALHDNLGVVKAIQEMSQGLGLGLEQADILFSWRGDKTALTRMVLAETPSAEVYKYLEAMASDEDETIRWAAMALAVDRSTRARWETLAIAQGQVDGRQAAKQVGLILRMVFADVGPDRLPHYWLHREFLLLLANEWGSRDADAGRLTREDIGYPMRFADVRDNDDLHPEVQHALRLLRSVEAAGQRRGDRGPVDGDAPDAEGVH